MAITLKNYLPKDEEDFWDTYNSPIGQRAKDYLEEMYPLELLMLEIEGTDGEIIVHAACIYCFITTKHVTSGGSVDIADEIGMQGIIEYIDEKCKNIIYRV